MHILREIGRRYKVNRQGLLIDRWQSSVSLPSVPGDPGRVPDAARVVSSNRNVPVRAVGGVWFLLRIIILLLLMARLWFGVGWAMNRACFRPGASSDTGRPSGAQGRGGFETPSTELPSGVRVGYVECQVLRSCQHRSLAVVCKCWCDMREPRHGGLEQR